jgi:hypothetical protein
MIYMLIPEICSEHASHLYVLESAVVTPLMLLKWTQYNYNVSTVYFFKL